VGDGSVGPSLYVMNNNDIYIYIYVYIYIESRDSIYTVPAQTPVHWIAPPTQDLVPPNRPMNETGSGLVPPPPIGKQLRDRAVSVLEKPNGVTRPPFLDHIVETLGVGDF
jgi:hypothetical protein